MDEPIKTTRKAAPLRTRRTGHPGLLAGSLGSIFGLLGIVSFGIVFVPLAAIFSIAGVCRGLTGSVAGFLVSAFGLVLTALGFIYSPTLWIVLLAILGKSMEKTPKTNLETSSSLVSQYDGLWVEKKPDCLDEDGPNSRTLIATKNLVKNQNLPIVDQYENHCLVENESKSGELIILNVTCFDFWEDFTNSRNGRKAVLKVSRRGDGIIINDKSYLRCPPPLPSAQ